MKNNLGNKQTMARNIQKYMEINDKTRQQVCDDLKIKYTTFTDWVKGNTYPRIDKIEMLANYFGVSKADLVEEQAPAPSTTADEDELLEGYRELTAENKRKLLEIAQGLYHVQEGDQILADMEALSEREKMA